MSIEEQNTMNIGDKVEYMGREYFVCGLSTMVYDDDCTGEPEWKITKEIQEVAIVEPFYQDRDYEFHKPAWVNIIDVKKLSKELS